MVLKQYVQLMQQKDLRFNKELMKFKGMKMTFLNLIDEYNNNDSWIGSRGDICSALQKEFEYRNQQQEEKDHHDDDHHDHHCHHHLYFNREVQIIDINKGIVNIRSTTTDRRSDNVDNNDNIDHDNDDNGEFSMEQFDLIVAADGAGS